MNKNNKTLVVQAAILASSGLITKLVGFIYRIPMANILGNEANGIYSVAFGIYSIALILSSYSMPVSISKLISERRNTDDYKIISQIFKVSIVVAIIVGSFACISLYISADILAELYNKPGIQMSLKILAPTTFVVAFLGCFRGYFQGYGNMVPTAVSQIIEQIINALVSIYAATQFSKMAKVMNNPSAVKAAGGTMGTFAGALIALAVILVFWSILKGKSNIRVKVSIREFRIIVRLLFALMLPIIFSQTVYQIGYTIDDFIFANIMTKKGFEEIYVTSIQGVFNTQYTQLINLPIGVATAFGVSVLPRISTAFINKDNSELNNYVNQIIEMTSIVVFPATIGLIVCSNEIMSVLFTSLEEYHSTAVRLLFYGAIATVFYSFSTVTTSILQGCNYYLIPVINSLASLIIHVFSVVYLLYYTDLKIYVLLIGDILFSMVIFLLNARFIKKHLEIRIEKMGNVLKHIWYAIIMGISILLVKVIIKMLIDNNIVLLITEIAVGVLVFGLLEIKLGTLDLKKLRKCDK